jgi:hypothetical protein
MLATSLVLAATVAACGGAKQTASAPAAAAPAPNVFNDAPPYASAPVARTASAAHAAKAVTVPAKAACLSCHKDAAKAPVFAFAGTIFADEGGAKGASDVEVRITDGKGKSLAAHSDADGNFWLPGAALASTVHAGARSGAKTALMSVDVSGDCNDCHDAKFPMTLK